MNGKSAAGSLSYVLVATACALIGGKAMGADAPPAAPAPTALANYRVTASPANIAPTPLTQAKDANLQQALQLLAGPDQTKAVVAAAKAWGQQDPKGYVTWALTLPPALYEPIRQASGACGKKSNIKAAVDWLAQQDAPKITMLLQLLPHNVS